MNFPDLIRARRAWLTPPRLVLGGVVTTAVGALAALANIGSQSAEMLSFWVFFLQGMILFFYGVPAAVNDFVEEHRNNTWDMLRLTPLTALEIVAGRVAASTSYAVFLAAALAPWACFSVSLNSEPRYWGLVGTWTAMVLGFTAASATGIAAAALAARVSGGRVGNSGMAIGGLGFLVTGYTHSLYGSREAVQTIFGTVSGFAAMNVVLALAALWAFVAAVRTVGHLLSERQVPWALPAFMTSLWAAFVVWVPSGRGAEAFEALCVTAPAVVALLASFADGEGPEEWKAKFRTAERRRDWTILVPGWAASWLTVLLLAGLTFVVRPEAGRIAALVVAFLARDLILIGVLRIILRRNVEVAAVALLGALYILPVLCAAPLELVGSLHWLVPMEAAKTGFLANLLPGILHATAAGALFWSRVRGLKTEGKLLR